MISRLFNRSFVNCVQKAWFLLVIFIELATLVTRVNVSCNTYSTKYLPAYIVRLILLCLYLYCIMAPDSKEERYFYFNTLAILLKAVQNEHTTIDLRNEASVYGIVEHTDA